MTEAEYHNIAKVRVWAIKQESVYRLAAKRAKRYETQCKAVGRASAYRAIVRRLEKL